jgi:DNA modification methylase
MSLSYLGTYVHVLRNGFEYLGAETDPEYAEIAKARLLAVREGKTPPVLTKGGLEQLTLF